jgi:solute carrier family 45 protein 1/2/4
MQLIIVSLPAIAINMVWISEFSAIIPYMKNFGMSNQDVSLVTIAGPLTGLFIAPTIGVWSDTTRSRFGRRTPYILGGAFFSILFQQLMSYSVELSELTGGSAVNIVIACFVGLDTAANVMMTPHRALVADLAGDRQTFGQALVSISSTFGSLIVTGFSSIWNPTIYIHEFMYMSSGFILATVALCVTVISEASIYKDTTDAVPDTSMCVRLGETFSSIFVGVRTMPRKALPAFASIFFWYCSYSTLGSFWVAFAAETILDGEAGGAESCAQSCTPGQDTYNRGVVQANQAALVANCIGVAYNILLPLIVRRVGMRVTYTCSTIFVALAFAIARSESMASASSMYIVYASIANAAATVLPYAVVSSVCSREAPDRLGLYLGSVNTSNVAGQLVANMLTTLTSSTSWGYGRPIFIGAALGCGAPLCGLLLGPGDGTGRSNTSSNAAGGVGGDADSDRDSGETANPVAVALGENGKSTGRANGVALNGVALSQPLVGSDGQQWGDNRFNRPGRASPASASWSPAAGGGAQGAWGSVVGMQGRGAAAGGSFDYLSQRLNEGTSNRATLSQFQGQGRPHLLSVGADGGATTTTTTASATI